MRGVSSEFLIQTITRRNQLKKAFILFVLFKYLKMNRGRRRPYEDTEGGERYFKRRRTSSHTEKKEEDPIKSQILTAGEKTNSVETSIESVAKSLESELATQKAKILELLVEVVTTHPEKCSVYSTLAGLLNAKNYNFGGEYVETLVKTFKEHLKSGNWLHAQYTLRFISDLVNSHVISATSLLQLYDTFMEGAVDSTVPQVRRDWLVYAILNCLPWVGRELYDKKEQTVERLMMTIDNFMRKRKRTHVGMLRVWSTDEHHKQEEYLECLWLQVEKLKLDGWIEKHINRPYLAFDSVLCEALQHNLPQISLPPHHENMIYPAPSVVYRMFDYTDCPEGPLSPVLPGTHSIERFLIEQELRDILRKYHNERREW
ncbi:Nuclear cap-binding protein subunit 1 [Orchesella cincta]|uniref:Nuclear cap-binding protein subunit 1 n=1 Tax=Orchesella cincta TaxID=48709 RepID=A0A1D2MV56_ORCCI|nr:Nuclear cap-binding protein subunit 1 [Orchesella cincta]